MTGYLEARALYAGQSAGGVKRIQPAGEIVGQLAEEAVRAIEACGKLLRIDEPRKPLKAEAKL